jgi:hypothetical protein
VDAGAMTMANLAGNKPEFRIIPGF